MHGIGWTMWDFAGDFGLVTKRSGQIVVDESIVSALGLGSADPMDSHGAK
jgi:hypothetical protein